MTIEGIWVSHYEYGKGEKDEPQSSEHKIQFLKVDGKWIGKSLTNENGSEVNLKLLQNGNDFSGKWHEYTSPNGFYKGREFNGLILLLLSIDGQTLSGKWLGAGSSSGRVKSGSWTFKRD